MATLSEAQRVDCWAELMREWPHDDTIGAMTKADLRVAVDALDQFLSDNAAAVNTAIPQPARGVLTTKQKAMMLIYVVRHRYLMEG